DRRQRRHLTLVEPMNALFRNLRFGARMLRRTPGFTLVAVLCLTLGIASNAAVYSWIEGILLRPYPGVAGQDRMVVIAGTNRGEGGRTGLSWPDFRELRDGARLFDAFVVNRITGTTLSNGDRAERIPGQIVSSNYFGAIGVRPLLGRGFTPDEDAGQNAHP